MIKEWTTIEIHKDGENRTYEENCKPQWVLLSKHKKEILVVKRHERYFENQAKKLLEEVARLERENKEYEQLLSTLFADKGNFKVMNKPTPEQVKTFVDELIKRNVTLEEENKELELWCRMLEQIENSFVKIWNNRDSPDWMVRDANMKRSTEVRKLLKILKEVFGEQEEASGGEE